MTMKLPCCVVRDLLPLYAENLAEPQTQLLVEEHLEQCEACRQALSGLQPSQEAQARAAAPLKNLKRQIQRRRMRAAALAAACAFVLIFAFFFRTGSLRPLPWEEGLIEAAGIEKRTEAEGACGGEKEALVLRTNSRIAGVKTQTMTGENGEQTVFLQGMGRPDSWLSNRPVFTVLFGGLDRTVVDQDGVEYGELVFCPVPDRVIYGYGEEQHLLWGSSKEGGTIVLPRLALAYYLLLAGICALFLGILWAAFRKGRREPVLRQLFFAPAAYVLGHLLLKGRTTVTLSLGSDLCSIALVSAAVYLIFTLGWQAWMQYKREK